MKGKRHFYTLWILIIFAIACAIFSSCYEVILPEPEFEPAEIVLINGKIWTANDLEPDAEAVAVSNDKIIAVGTTEEISKYITENSMVIDLKQRRVVPGFQDSHAHFFSKAIKTNNYQDPYTPEYSGYNEYQEKLNQFLMGSVIIGVKALDSSLMDMLPATTYPSKNIAENRLKRGIDELLKMGITTIFELGTDWKCYDLLLSLKEKGELRIRCELYIASRYLDDVIEKGIDKYFGDEWVRVLGVKFCADGWLGSRTCAVREPFNDKTFPWQLYGENKGVLYMNQEKANSDILKAHQANLKIAVHTIGDRAAEIVLNAYENALNEQPKSDHRYTLEHASILPPDLVERIKNLDVIPSIQFSFATTDQHFTETALGEERSQYAYIWKTLIDEGIICAGGTDFNPEEVIAPLWGIQRVVTRQEVDGTPEGGWHPEERISVEDALRLITINSAYNSFEEDTKGSIETGKYADIVVLSRDILEIPPDEISTTQVDMTMIGGEIFYKRPDSGL